MSAEESYSSELPSFDPRIFWINIRYKLFIPLTVGILVGLLTHKATQYVITDQWEASSYLIRHGKNMSRQNNIPYLYLDTDITTVLETILLRDNLEQVIQALNLRVSPEELRRTIRVSKGNKSNIVKVTSVWEDKNTAVKISDMVSETFLLNYSLVQNAAATKIQAYYKNKLNDYNDKLIIAYLRENAFLTKFNILDFAAQKLNYYKTVSELELRLMDEEIHLSDLKLRLSKVEQELANTSKTVLISKVVRSNANTLTHKLTNELKILRKRYTDDNPKIQHLLHKISALEGDKNKLIQPKKSQVDETKYGYNPVYGELQLLKIQHSSEIMALEANLSKYNDNIKLVTKQIAVLLDLEKQHYDVKHTVESNQDMVQSLETRLLETSIAMESNISDFDILERAQLPKYPQRSFRKLIAILAAGSLFLFILGYILIREFFDTTLKTAFDLSDIPSVKFSAVLPNKDEVSHATFYSQFQLFFSAMNRALLNRPGNLLCISSLSSEEGTSFISNEVIEFYCSRDRKVLHVELLSSDGIAPKESIINDVIYAGGSCSQIETQSLSENLDRCYFEINKKIYLDILEIEKLKRFLDSCQKEYDIVVWEVFSPNQHMQLFRTLCQCAAFNIIVAKSGTVPKSALTRTLSLLAQWEVYHVGLLLNLLPNKYISKAA